MNNLTFQSVIQITKQRDNESLDRSLMTALAENLPLRIISLFKLTNEIDDISLEPALCLSVRSEGNNKTSLQWDEVLDETTHSKSLKTCIADRKKIVYRNSDHQLFNFYPIVCEEKIVGAIEICAPEDLNHKQELIDNLIQVYGNCLFHINKSERDKLTGLLNRHSFETKFKRLITNQQVKQRLAFEHKTANKHRQLAADSFAWLAIFDIDHFKRVNDQYGHVCGDEVLLKLSQKMKAFFRSSDLLFRFGGEEFVVILEPIPQEMAQRTLERFREKIEKSVFPLVENITTSGGYIKITDADYPTAFIERADQALYHAKSNGRNKICNYELLVDSGELPEPKEIGGVDLF